jgi:alkylhydroperoxidase family enzyme
MAFIKTISPAESSGEVREMYASEQEDWGFVPDYARTFCHRPQVMDCWSKLLREIRRPVDPRRIELVTFAAAYESRHSPCSLAHGSKLAGMIGKEALIALTAGREDEVLDPTDAAIWRYARQIARDASQVTAADVEALRETHGLSDAEIFDIAANAASRSFFTKLLDALGVDADRGFLEIEADLRQALTIGRPIAAHAAEMLSEE